VACVTEHGSHGAEFGMAFAFQQAAGGMLNGFFMFGAHKPSHMVAKLSFR